MAVCVYGDSIARGIAYDESKDKYVYLKNCFVDKLGQKANIAVTNYARFGCTIAKGAEILVRRLDKLSSFSHTLLEFGGNDCDLQWDEISLSPDSPHLPKVPLPQFEEIYVRMAEMIKAAGSIPIALTLPPLDPERFFKWVSKGLDREKILKFLGDINTIYTWQASYSDAIEGIAKKHSIRIIDIRGAFLGEKAYSDYLCVDGMHPNAKGHSLIGRLFDIF